MFWVLVGLVLLLSVVLVIMVILQPSKGGGSLGSAFGGLGASLGSTFGSRRTLDFLAKGTTYVAATIAALCLIANIFFVPTASVTSSTPITTGAAGGATTPVAPPTAAPGAGAPGGAAPGGSAPATPDAGQQATPPPPAGEQAPTGTNPGPNTPTPPPAGGR